MSLKQQSGLEQELASLPDWLAVAILTPTVNFESRLAPACKKLATANDKIDELPAEVKTGRDRMDYNRLRASDQCSRAVDEKLKAEFNHYREVLA